MREQDSMSQPAEQNEASAKAKRNPVTLENSPEETIIRMRCLPERAAKLRETIRAFREANSR